MKYFFSALFVIMGSFKLNAQTTFQQSYDAFKQQAKKDYEDFRRKANEEYAEWMRQAWEWHDKVEPVLCPKEETKPPVIYQEQEEQKDSKPIPYDDVLTIPEPNPQPNPIAPIREDDGEYQKVVFQFYGTEGMVRAPKNGRFKIHGKDEAAYAKAWEELSSEQYDNLIRDCLVLRMKHQLCDWAYLRMLGQMSEAVCGKGTNEATMLQAFVLCQSGYKIRLGFTKANDLRLLFKSEHLIYDLEGFRMKDGLFYILQPVNEGGLSICDISYPEEKPLSLWITQEQLVTEQLSEERLLIPEDSMIAIHVKTNKNLVQFYNDYPTSMIGDNPVSRWAMYARAPLSAHAREALYPQLYDILKNADIVNAANWLLYWVQTAFVYEYDDKVWGKDRAFFAEETLFYPYCDCEDRSVLYARLVHDLLGLKVILVYYPGHLATAVLFNIPINGDYIDIDGLRYTVCDPTYIGAPIGVSMPDMDNASAKVVMLE